MSCWVKSLSLLTAVVMAASCSKKATVTLNKAPAAAEVSSQTTVLENLRDDLTDAGLSGENADFIVSQAQDAIPTQALRFSLDDSDISYVGPNVAGGAMRALSDARSGMADATNRRDVIKVILNSVVGSFQLYKDSLSKEKSLAFEAVLASVATSSLQPAGLTSPDFESALADVSTLVVSVAQQLGNGTSSVSEVVTAISMGLVNGLQNAGLSGSDIVDKMKYIARGATEGAGKVTDSSLEDVVGSVSSGVTKGLSNIKLEQTVLTQASKSATSAITSSLPAISTDSTVLKAVTSKVATSAIDVLKESGASKEDILNVSAEIVSSTVEGLNNAGVSSSVVDEVSQATQNSASDSLAKVGLSSNEIISKLQAAIETLKAASIPDATINGAPTSGSSATSLSLVIGGANVVTFKYAIVAGTSCSSVTYGEEKDAKTAQTVSLSTLPDGPVVLCVIGKSAAGSWQTTPASTSWEKLTPSSFTFLVDSSAPAGATATTTANSTTLTFAGASGAKFCITTSSDTPSSTSSCWGTSNSQTVSLPAATTTTVYGWGKSATGTIILLGSKTFINTSTPTATIGGLPVGGSSNTSFTLTVGGTGLSLYKYAVLSGSTCVGAVYGSIMDGADTSTVDVSGLADGSVTLCVLGKFSGTWQSEATTTTWEKLTNSSFTFAVKDQRTGSLSNTNSTTLNVAFSGPSGAKFCVSTTSSAPATDDSCWTSSTTATTSITASSTENYYGWGKSQNGTIISLGSQSVAHSVFSDFAGATSASSSVAKHILLSWTPVTSPHNFDRYKIYRSTTSGSFDYSSAYRTVMGGSKTSASVGGLNDNTTYYFVVRAATANIEDNNTQEQSATTKAFVSLPNTGTPSSIYTALNNYFSGFNLGNIDIGEIVTVAGKADDAYSLTTASSIGLARVGARLDTPKGLAIAADGTLYVIGGDNAVHKIDTHDNYTVVAGIPGWSSDAPSGTVSDIDPATDDVLGEPDVITMDPDGSTLVVGETNFHIIRKLTTDGVLHATYGTGVSGDSSSGYVVSNSGSPATQKLGEISGLVYDSSGNLYISEYNNNRVKRIDTNGQIHLFAGAGGGCPDLNTLDNPTSLSDLVGDEGPALNAKLCGPRGLAIDSQGQVFIADSDENLIRYVSTDGNIHTFAGTGYESDWAEGDDDLATNAKMKRPWNLGFDSSGNLYFTDSDAHRVRKVDTDGNIHTVAGGGWKSAYSGLAGTDAQLGKLKGLVVNSAGEVVFTDEDYNLVSKLGTDGNLTVIVGQNLSGNTAAGSAAISSRLNWIGGMDVDSAGNIYISDSNNGRVRKVTTDGVLHDFAGNGSYIWTTDGMAAASANICLPNALKIGPNGDVYFGECNRIYKVDNLGKIYRVAGDPTTSGGANQDLHTGFSADGSVASQSKIQGSRDIIFDSQGRLVFSESDSHRVRRIETDGTLTTLAGNGTEGVTTDGTAALSAPLKSIHGLTYDTAGNLYIVEYNNNRVLKMNTAGIISTFIGTGTAGEFTDGTPATQAALRDPVKIIYDANTGEFYLSQFSNSNVNVVKIATDGKAYHVAGSNTSGFAGDGGPATSAAIDGWPYGLVLDSSGNLYVGGGNHVRYIRLK